MSLSWCHSCLAPVSELRVGPCISWGGRGVSRSAQPGVLGAGHYRPPLLPMQPPLHQLETPR